MSQRRRTKGTFKTDKFGRIEVESPQLADFLSSLSSGASGVLLEPLEVTFQGGVGGADEGYVFDAGTSLEDVLRVICTGVPSTGLQGLDLYDGNATRTSGAGSTFLFEVGFEVSLDNFDVTLVGVNEFEPEINMLQVNVQNTPLVLAQNLTVDTDASEIAGSFNVDNTADGIATANVLTLGGLTSDFFVSPSTNGGAVSMESSFTARATLIDGGVKTTTLSMQHVLPAFVLNIKNTAFNDVLLFASFGQPTLVETSILGAISAGIANIIKQDLQEDSDYNNYDFSNEGGDLSQADILAVLCVPEASFHSGTPVVTGELAGSASELVNAITAIHDIDLDLQSLGIINGFPGQAQAYRMVELTNPSAWYQGAISLNFS